MSGILPERTNGTSDPELLNAPGPSSPIQSPNAAIPRSSLDDAEPDPSQLKHELAVARQEKEVLGNQYRNLLGKLTAMRQSLGEKLREDAEELDRRESAINTLSTENSSLQTSITTIQTELVNASQESSSLQAQLAQLRSQSDSSSSDVLSLTREMRELRGEMERLRVEREEWEFEAGRERERREIMEEEVRGIERREREGRRDWEKGKEELLSERERARNLQDVLGEFQAAKDSELRQATTEVESHLRLAATGLSEYKLRTANAETRLAELANDATRSERLERELREKNQVVGKLRHDAVVNNEHLTEALRRLRKTSSDNNVDRRLVTNILLSFLNTHRGDSKRFEMLSLLSTILSWNDVEREKAGLQRVLTVKSGTPAEKGKRKDVRGERSAEEEAAMNESFSNLFVEFLLKESSQGQSAPAPSVSARAALGLDDVSSSIQSPPPGSGGYFSPPYSSGSGVNTPGGSSRSRTFSTSSMTSISTAPGFPTLQRKPSHVPQQALDGDPGT